MPPIPAQVPVAAQTPPAFPQAAPTGSACPPKPPTPLEEEDELPPAPPPLEELEDVEVDVDVEVEVDEAELEEEDVWLSAEEQAKRPTRKRGPLKRTSELTMLLQWPMGRSAITDSLFLKGICAGQRVPAELHRPSYVCRA
jgi:hypothetical protein